MLLHQLPTELLLEIVRDLRHHDLAQLAQVSRRFQAIVEPIIWESIELHPSYFHKARRPKLLRGPEDYKFLLPTKSMRYNGYQRHLMDEATTYFFRVCGIMRRDNPKRWRQLASRVRSLCVTIDEANGVRPGYVVEGKPRELDCWNTLLGFENLEVLDVIARKDAEHNRQPLELGTRSFKKLRSLRMRGYFPRSVVRKLYHGAPNLQKLDLGTLHFSPDLPSRDSGSFESDFLEAEGGIFPRFMTGLFDTPTTHSPFLTRVHLCKPTEPADRAKTDWDKDPEVPRDVLVLREWAAFLRQIRNTVVDLTLEHRQVITGSFTNRNPYVDRGVAGDIRFCNIVLPVFLEDDEWPMLRRLEFRSIEICQEESLDCEELLRLKFPKVDVSITQGYYMIYMGGPHISHFDHEDGLLPRLEK